MSQADEMVLVPKGLLMQLYKALDEAQETIKKLTDLLASKGKEVEMNVVVT